MIRLSGNDARLKMPIKTISYVLSFTSKTVLKIFPLRRYTEVLVSSVDTKILKSKIILKNDVSLPYQYEGVLVGVLERY